MDGMINYLYLIPLLPLIAASVSALLPKHCRRSAAFLAIATIAISFLLSLVAFIQTLGASFPSDAGPLFRNVTWIDMGGIVIKLGWLLDPMAALMLVMVTLISLLVFIYSVGYMAEDGNFTRFFCFLSLFAAAMLGLVIANSLLLLFICWELVGLASYLLIGFWYDKPSAAAAAKKAFITTRIGDLGLFLGMIWLSSSAGTLLFYDGGNGCLEQSAVAGLVGRTTAIGMTVATAVGLLIFCGAVGKSGQVPLHVWLPDAMEGPTPVSALIHAATMVAAGVFLLARVYPILDADPAQIAGYSTALTVVTWTGAITALFAASIAVAQNDIKRILAYSTVSQLGFMMVGIGTGGIGVGMFHLITHAFFKALLFLGAGSVIHGCHGEQDIRRMGALREWMPTTFAAYAVGMMALSGVPIFFSGFWSKDEILHSAQAWKSSYSPFFLVVCAALLTAFYMTRQMALVFYGKYRGASHSDGVTVPGHEMAPHESPAIMTKPLKILAFLTVALALVGTPAWPWIQEYLEGAGAHFDPGYLFQMRTIGIILLSSVIAVTGIFLGWRIYSRARFLNSADEPDPLETRFPKLAQSLKAAWYVDDIYAVSVIRFQRWLGTLADLLDRTLWAGAVQLVSLIVSALSWVSRAVDEYLINQGFNRGCRDLKQGGRILARWNRGDVQSYLRIIGVALCLLSLILIWGGMKP